MKTAIGRARLDASDGPLLAVVGVFDGLHRGHAWLLGHVVHEARTRRARPAVITFDAHPDAILLGHAPPLLMDPAERLERLAALGVEIVVVEHFDDRLRQTPYDAFIHGITSRCELAGIVMTPDAAFGHERGGTPTIVAALGARDGFDVIVVQPFEIGDREVRSSEIRSAIAAGDLSTAERLLGRPYAIVGDVYPTGTVAFAMPVALPPPGTYRVAGAARSASVAEGGRVTIEPIPARSPLRVEFVGRSSDAGAESTLPSTAAGGESHDIRA